jgi:Beta-lactamase
MTKPRSYPVTALLCFSVLFYEASKLWAQAMLPPEIQSRIESVGACLKTRVVEKDDPHACQKLFDRMAVDHVPGVSIAVIHNGAIEWARGFGLVQLGGAQVTAETLFQAGSISKPVAAMAALRLVEQGKLSLDADVNQTLTSWSPRARLRRERWSRYASCSVTPRRSRCTDFPVTPRVPPFPRWFKS